MDSYERGNFGSVWAAAAGLALALLAADAASAQTAPASPSVGGFGASANQAAPGQNQPPPVPQWVKLCGPDPTTSKKTCVVQEDVYADTGELATSAVIRSVDGDPKMQFILTVPPGMLIQPGIQFQIDNTGKPTSMKYSICFPNVCYADMDITADFLKPLRSGKQLVVAALDQAGQTETLPIPLTGFAEAYDGQPVDPNTAAGQATLNSLQSSLQAHADAARQTLTNQLPQP
jgi:invasion protein IalB